VLNSERGGGGGESNVHLRQGKKGGKSVFTWGRKGKLPSPKKVTVELEGKRQRFRREREDRPSIQGGGGERGITLFTLAVKERKRGECILILTKGGGEKKGKAFFSSSEMGREKEGRGRATKIQDGKEGKKKKEEEKRYIQPEGREKGKRILLLQFILQATKQGRGGPSCQRKRKIEKKSLLSFGYS